MANRPYQPPRILRDAKELVERMALIDKKVANILNSKNQRDIERLNQGRRPFPRLAVGDRVWVKRPEGSGTKLETRWIGPGLVVNQRGEHSYKVEIERDRFLEVPTKFLKPFWEDSETLNSDPVPPCFGTSARMISDGLKDWCFKNSRDRRAKASTTPRTLNVLSEHWTIKFDRVCSFFVSRKVCVFQKKIKKQKKCV